MRDSKALIWAVFDSLGEKVMESGEVMGMGSVGDEGVVGGGLVHVLTTLKPSANENETLAEARARMKWEQDDYICKGHILNAMSDTLFDIYQGMGSASEIWNALAAKYLAEDASSKKFTVSILLDDSFIVPSIIDKLPPNWKDFRKSLKHKKEEMSIEDLAQCLRIEEESRIRDKKENETVSSKIHLVENVKNSNQQRKGNWKRNKHPEKNTNKNKKRKGACFNCGKPGHYKSECRLLKDKKSGAPTDKEKFVAMISEANMLEDGNDWWIDSGATMHVCKDRNLFSTYETVEDGSVLYMGNSSTAEVKGKGKVELEFTSGKRLTLTGVYHVPEVRKNLVSGSILNKNGFKLVFESDKFILSKGGTFVGKGYMYEGMFKLNINKVNVFAYVLDSSLSLWHNRLGHVNTRKMNDMVKLTLIPKYENDLVDRCKTCMQTKIITKSFPKVDRTSNLLDLIHSDVCDIHSVPTKGGKKYFVTFIDDYSRYCYVYLLSHKDEVLEKFKIYKTEVENQCITSIKCLRSDRGGEYHFPHFCESVGIVHESSAPYTPQQNGVAERKNRTLTEMINAMLVNSGLNKSFWGEALLTACHILNRVPSKKSDITPYELWKKRKPNLSYLKVWGCRSIVKVPKPKLRKLGERGIECIFLGYASHSKAYRFLVIEPNDFIDVNTIIESRDAFFYENRFTAIPKEIEPTTSVDHPLESQTEVGEPSVQPSKIRRSSRDRRDRSFGPDFVTYLVEGTREKLQGSVLLNLSIESDPQTYGEAIKSQDVAFWKEAINDEMDSIMGNKTWILIDLPPGSKPIGCKWIFKKKINVNGTIEKFKARLVAKGFTQKPGIDYFDTYAPVARISTIRVLIALASIYKLHIHQMDVKTAFLNGELDEEVYMEQPEGFILPGQEHKVCKLIKSLYGLKQAPKQWHERFDKVLVSNGYKIHESDKCIYSKFKGSKGVVICLYVDDMLIFGTDIASIQSTKSYLSQNFDMKDMGEADVILGIRIIRQDNGLILTQSHYIEKVLKKFNHFECSPISTPFDPNIKLYLNTGRTISQLGYASVIGSLMYAMTCTRPDIAYAVGKLSRFTSNPSFSHWNAVYRVLKYLKKTIDYGLCYSGYPTVIEGYSDASWITERIDHLSTSGWIFTLGGGAVSWASKKQTCITTSTMEAEFIALPSANENETLAEARARMKWEQDDYICKGHILNAMSDTLFDIYQGMGSASEIWNALAAKYLAEDASSKKFTVSILLDDSFIVPSIIDKLPPNWKDFRKSLKHKKEEMSIEDLAQCLRIEEESRIRDKKENETVSSKIHLVENVKNSNQQRKGNWKRNKHPEKNTNKNKKRKGACFNCGKPGHYKSECRLLKDKKSGAPTDKEKFVAMISEANMLEDGNDWWIDSGATMHVCKDRNLFSTYETVEDGSVLYMGNPSTAEVKGKGKVELEFTSGKRLTLTGVYHVPEVRKNLVSGSILNKNGFKLVFESDKFILSKGGTFVGKGYMYEGMFKLNINKVNVFAYVLDSSLSLWHNRLGHVNTRKMNDMVKLTLIPKYENDLVDRCKTCMQTKIITKSFPKVDRTSNLLDLIHSDVCDIHSVPTKGGKKYFVTFIDDYSRYCYVYLLSHKDEVLEKFKIYKTEVENQCITSIKCLRSDRGGEYHFPHFCESVGIVHESSAPYTPQQNGVAERKNRTLTEMINAMLVNSGLNKSFWGEALLTACHILNRVPSKKSDITPYELWKKRKPNLSYLKVWGCRSIVKVPKPKLRKLGERGIECIFLGYASHSKAYRFLVIEPNDFIDVNTIIESRDAFFYENRFTAIPKEIEPTTSVDHPLESQTEVGEPSVQPSKIRRSSRDRRDRSFGPDFVTYLVEGTREKLQGSVLLNLSIESDPQTYGEAIKSQDVAFWKEAINDEMDSIMGNKTWILIDLPPGSKPIGCKWIFKKKINVNGTIEKFKARLVAKGFTQKPGIDYFDTYAPVARISTIRVLIALASIYKLHIHQMDVKTAFLNGELDEEVYMEQPEGFILPGQEHKVCKLIKSLYGLKQAPKQWHERFDKVLVSNGYKIHESDKCIYSKFKGSKGVVICLYVDDMLIFGTDIASIQSTKSYLSQNFDMKDMGEADVILGIRIIRQDNGLILTQSHYIEKVLKKFNHFECSPISTPFDPNIKLYLNTGRTISQLGYASVIGSLMYAMTCTRPDIAYVVVVHVLTTLKPSANENETLAEARARMKWEQDDYICKGHILNAMSDTLFDIYQGMGSASEIWNALAAKYLAEDASSKKFTVSILLDDSFIVPSIIDKLPPNWKDFRKSLKHKKEEMSIEDLAQCLRIEEESRIRDKKENETVSSKIHLVENVKNSNQQRKGNWKRNKHPEKNTNKNKKRKGACFNCGKPGHYKSECRLLKDKKSGAPTDKEKFVAMISEANMLEDGNDWWIDSGATMHVCKDRNLFSTYETVEDGSVLYMGNSSTAEVKGKGKVELEFTSGKRLTLTGVYHVPEVRKNLVSGSILNKNGFKLVFESDKFILSKGGTFVGKGYMYEGMFKLNINKVNVFAYVLDSSLSLWHNRLGHVNTRKMNDMVKLTLIPKYENDLVDRCKTCMQTKIITKSFPKVDRTSNLLDLIHSDVCDIHSVPTKGGKKYFVTFIDDYSRYCYVYLLSHKDEVLEKFKIYKTEVENQCITSIKCLRSDRGGEYHFPHFCESVGIVHESSAPYTPQQNGVAERKNRTLTEMINAMLVNSGLNKSFWGEALLTACHILNRVPSKKSDITPYELWKKRKPNLSYLKVWGCRSIVKVPKPKLRKLGERGIECIFLGYASHSKAYRFLVIEPNDFIDVNTIIESRDAFFYENRFTAIPKEIEPTTSVDHPLESQTEVGEPSVQPSKIRRSSRDRRDRSFGPDFVTYLVEGTREKLQGSVLLNLSIESDPQTYGEAIKSQDVAFWKEAINDEMDSIMGNKTWILIDLPPGSKPIGCKWIFKKKINVNGTIEKFKARLVAKGFTQKPGIDYFDTYAPVARISTIRVLIALASIYKLHIHQMDVKTAFLNGELDEEVYMEQPEGFILPGQEHKVCKLIKSLYGLKQAPKQWHERFDKVLVSNGYKIHESDKCIYSKFKGSKGVVICLYVDDMLIFGTDIASIQSTKSYLSQNFDMKDMGEADVILGIRIIRQDNGLILTQSHYIEKVLKKFNHFECSPISTPFDPNIKLYLNTGRTISQLGYASVIGSLMYAMTCTRPDIAYAVGKLSRFTSNPSFSHWNAVYRVLKYLKKTIDYGLCYSGYPTVIEGYSDASWITERIDHLSTSGWIFTLGGGAVSWASKKQTCITTSTMEAEFIALPSANENETLAEARARMKWEQDDYICKGHILNAMSDTLFDIYQGMGSASEIWNALAAKYLAEDASSKKFTVSILLDDSFIVPSIIDKLPPNWKDFRKSLKHKKEEMSIEDLAQCLRIEEESRIRDKKENETVSSKIHLVENVKNSNQQRKGNWKRNKHPEKNTNKNKKRKGACFNCGKPGHYKSECRLLKDKKSGAPTDKEKFVAMISEANMLEDGNDWWIDSGATMHVCKDRNLFSTYETVEDGSVLYMGNPSTAEVKGKGKVELEFTSGKRLTLTGVYHVPEVRKNLVSGSILNKNGFKLVFESDKFILSKGGTFVGKGYMYEGMFKLNINKVNVFAYVLDSSLSLWHNRLGHVNTRKMNDMVKLTLIPKYENDLVDRCKTCMQTKIITKSFPKVDRTSNLLDLIHSDVCDIHSVPTKGGKKYFVTFIDDYSRYCYVYLLSHKDEVLEKFKIYKTEVENQCITSIKCLRSDRGGEYHFPHFCESVGIVHESSAPYTPQQNGVAERKNRTLTEMINAMLVNSGLNKSFWGEALLTACHILNRVPSKKSDITPYELWKKRKPNLSYLKVWGCRSIVKVPKPKLRKLGERGIECIFLGYASHSKAYRFLVIEPNDFIDVNTIIESRDAFFYENRFTAIPKEIEPTTSVDHPLESQTEVGEPSVQPSKIRRSSRDRRDRSFGPDFVTYLVEGTREKLQGSVLLNLSIESDPQTYGEAIKSQDVAFWKEAINDEMDSIMGNKTWILIDLPPGSKPIGCKWIFKKKINVNGTIEKFKARLVAKGFTQKPGIDYFDTYAPVARISTIRVLIALASIYKLHIHQMDVKTAFLNGELDEEVYMEQPEGFILPGQEHKVCKLIKSLYGLKQAPKQWHERFDKVLVSNGYKIHESDKCIYSKFKGSKGVVICLYVDDMLIFGTDIASIQSTKSYLSQNFDMKDMGEADVILGIRIIRQDNGLILTQSHYIEKVLKKFNHFECSPISTPFDPNIKLYLNTGRTISQLGYASVIGSLMYAMTCTRPDIAYAVGKLSRFTSNPSFSHWNAVYRVLKYLKKTIDYGLCYSGYPTVIEGYSDASWITERIDHLSTSGWIFTLGGGAVSWASKKQTCITTSTMEAEFIALPSANENETLAEARARMKWEQDDYICKGHILNAMSDTLFDIYQGMGSASEIWNALAAKYLAEDASSKKFTVSILLDDSFIVPSIIDKLPPNWKDFRKSLKHKKEEMSIEDLAQCLRIEEESRIRDKKENETVSSKIHLVENVKNSNQQRKGNWKRNKHPEKNTNKNKKRKGACFNCGKPGHYKSECRLLKDKKSGAPTDKEKFVAMISEANMLEDGNDWWIDSGATMHVCKDRNLFSTYETVEDGSVLYMGNPSTAEVKGKGKVELEFTSGKRLTLTGVYHVPEVRKNLVSGSILNKNGFKLVFESDKFILSKGGTFVGKGYMYEGMFKLNINKVNVFAYVLDSSLSLWHNRLGHVNTRKMNDMVKLTLIPKYENDLVDRCKTCMQTKIITKSFPKVDRTSNLLDLIHSDVCDIHSVPTKGGKKYFVTFIDDYSRYCYVYLLSHKDEVLEKFKIYKTEVENQCITSIKCLRSDRGGEYHFPHFCESVGIVHESSAPYTPQQNGVAERKNRTLTEMINAMLVNSGLNKSFWGEALLTACHILNRVPSKKSDITPYELWKKRKPNLSYLKVWGCRSIVKVPKPKLRKLGERGIECIFLGYASHSKAYRFLVIEPNDFIDVNTIIESRDAFFYENRFTAIPKEIEPTTSVDHPLESQTEVGEPSVQPSKIRRSSRDRRDRSFGPDFVTYLVEGTREKLQGSVLLNLSIESDPQTYGEAIKSQDVAFWKEAINDEMDSIMGNKTWILIDLPPGSKPIGCKWIFKKKINVNGTIEKFKARLVAKGFTQKPGIDYFDTYAPVARISTIRVLIALASIYKLHIHQMDVKTAFLNGELDEEVYMEQPEGFILPGQEHKVCKLIKSLYGLKQAPKQWHERFDKVLVSNGYKIHESDKCIYSKFKGSKGVVICLYVDDMLIFGTDIASIQSTKSYLSQNFDMKDMGEADVILGIRIIRQDNGLILTQSHYIEKVLKKFNHFECSPISTPFDPNIKLYLNTGRTISQLGYASVIGSLMYAMTCTRPDIAYAVGKLSRFTSNPSFSHWNAVYRVLKYLKKTIDYGLCYSGYPTVIEGYSDASWITERIDHLSTSGWIFTLGGGAVSWASKKQTCITTSTMEAEFIALPSANENETLAEARARMKWEQDDYICKGHILNAMSDTLFDIYQGMGSASEIWNALAAKYLAEDASSKKFTVSILLDDSFIVPSIIDKLPPNWKDFRKSLKHKKEEMSIEDLAQCLRIEEESRIRDKKENETVSSKIHLVENVKNSNQQRKGNWKRNKHPEKNTNKNKKRKGACFNCGKPGHYKSECRLLKDKKSGAPTDKEKFVAMISEANMLEDGNDWWIDSGATMHVCKDRNLFSTYETVEDGSVLYMGNSSTAEVKGKGKVELEFTSGKRLTLTGVYHVPEVRKNLVSGSILNKNGFKLVFESDKFILSKGGTFVGKGYMYEGMFKLNINKVNVFAYVLDSSLSLWHNRLGHVNTRKMNDMVKLTLIPKYENDLVDRCKTCMQTKIITKSFPKVDRTSNLLDLIHSDVCDIHSVPTKGGKKYFVTFIDDYSRYCYVYLLSHKDEVLEKFKIYKTEVENQCITSIKCLRSDRGGEYHFPHFCESVGIVHESSAPYTPQQNGVAERKNRTLTEMINAMLVNSGLNKSFWGEALLTACHILNRVPSKKSDITPYELWKKRKPNLSYLKVWGCRSIVKVPKPKLRKLGERGIECIFLGYASHSKAYRFLVIEPNDFIDVNTIIESRDAFFYENRFTAIPKEIEPTTSVDHPLESQTEVGEPSVQPSKIRRSSRDRRDRSFGPDFVTYLVEGTREKLQGSVLLNLSIESDPQTYGEAIKSQDVAFWKEAINDEMDSIMGNKTWILIDLPPGSKPIGCKWIFKKKINVNGTIEKFKARLVAKGFTQKPGIDYFDTYAPVARISTIRVLIALASIYKLHIHQMDVKTAFLNGELDEEVYMEQPEGFILPGQEHKVCKLIKSLYGLKQAPKQWHERFDKVLVSNGYKIHESDKCIYSKFKGSKGVVICLYVDDMLIFGTDIASIQSTKSYLSQNFDMKDMGEADVILGIRIIRQDNGLILTQSHYIEKVLKKFNHFECSPISTPFDPNIKLYLNTGRTISQLGYASVIGSLMYAMTCTRPDIAYAVGKLSRFTSNPSFSHWNAVYRVLKYLKKTIDYGLCYSGYPTVIEGYSDASWITERIDHLSTSGWIFTLGGGAVSWASKKQTCITTSTMEAEFIALPSANENETLAEARARMKWEQDDYICKGHILNAMSDTLFDIYQGMGSASEIWNALAAKYLAEDASSKKFTVSILLDDSFIVPSIIDKLPPNWKDFRKSLKHKKEEMSIEDLAQCLRIEEESRIRDKKENETVSSKIHLVENVKNSNQQRKGNWKRNKHPEKNTNKNKKRKGACFNCGKPGHYKSECRLLKDKKSGAPTDKEKFVAMISEANMLEDGNDWWIDSGATMHVCKDRNLFSTYETVEDGSVLYMGNSSTAEVKGKGKVELEFTSGKRLTLTGVYHVPEVRKNLVSGSILNKNGFKLVFESDKFILSKGGTFVGKGYMYEGMFKLNINKVNVFAYVLDSSLSLWHNRLGHVNTRKMNDMVKLTLIPKYENDLVDRCKTCMQTKIITKSFPKVDRTSNLLDLIHSDVCDIHSVPTKGGKKYFVTFIDDYSRYCYVYLLSHKDEVLEKFKIYKTEVENQCITSIKCLRSDRGGEYHFPHFCESVGIVHESSAPYTPQQNGVAERKNRTLTEMINAMLVNSGLNKSFWGEALLTACHILNRVPSKKSDITPYELWKKRKPNLSYLKVWGCRSIVKVPKPKLRKLGERGIECIFLGYASHSKAYRFLVIEPNDFIDVNTIIESRDAFFYENRFTAIPKEIEPTTSVDHPLESQTEVGEPSVQPSKIRRSSRDRRDRSFGPDFVTYLVEGTREKLQGSVLLNLSIESDPQTYGEAIKSQDVAFWKEAINDEMDSIMGNKTWILIDLPPGSKPIGCKWIFKKKINVNGTIEKFKARLVAKGFTQKPGIDYFDTYAPVARISTIRVLIALASIYKLHIHQMDVKTAFLNGELDEEVYMEQPEGFILPGQEHKVCKLIKSLYGLKQAPKQWHERFDKVLVSNGYKIHESDKCIYSKFKGSKGVVICLYVDDMLIFGTDIASIQSTKSYLSQNFDMKDMGEADVILGIRIIRQDNGLILTQSHYIEKVLKKFNHFECSPISTPFDPNIKLYLNTGRTISQLGYASVIGSLMYAMTCTRPDIAYAVGKLSRFTSNPSFSHWNAVYRVLKYLKKTIDYGLCYSGYPTVIEGYSDASWITERIDHLSTSGWIFTLGGGAVSWASKKQTCITTSTMEAEFIALMEGMRMRCCCT
ncbi:uncharacterized protein LOC143850059 [Tasmannia lanceolata]|uniref:uncharacterized protein LOC143850059 n=1 Tax=Tasmannia lanceolata TaxID=3420 RepID=UPI004063593D